MTVLVTGSAGYVGSHTVRLLHEKGRDVVVLDTMEFGHEQAVGTVPLIESFNGRMRDEHLNGQQFDSLLEAQVLTEDWRIDYNINRPHSSHGWLTPVEFVEDWLHQQQLQLA